MRIKPIYIISAIAVILTSCIGSYIDEPYEGTISQLKVALVYPEGEEEALREGVEVKVENISNLAVYTSHSDEKGVAVVDVPKGIYRVSVSDKLPGKIFNGLSDKVLVNGPEVNLDMLLVYSDAGALVIKEIYHGGCLKVPEEGDYQLDKYFIIHNNSEKVIYLDSLCFGTMSPYNSHATNPWVEKNKETGALIFGSFAPVIEAIWQFGGDGKTFPLEPGEDAVVCINGAIDHAARYPNSVNLNKSDYFVCYDNQKYSEAYHPVPGPAISQERYLHVVAKMGPASGYVISVSSPTLLLFRSKGMTIQEYVQQKNSIIPTPGDSHNNVAVIPWDWILDGVEVFTGTSSRNAKRIAPMVDAGYVTLSEPFQGKTVFRKVDEEASAAYGFEVLMDSNNSSVDFYEREKQSLHE